MRAVILSGSGRYADPWHRFDETSAALAGIVAGAGYRVEASDDLLGGFAALDDIDLVVVNAGDPDGPMPEGAADPGPVDESRVAAATAGFEAALERGIGILAVHAAASTLREVPAFGAALGARWVEGESWHPELGDARVHVVGSHAIAEGLADFTVTDERYAGLRLDGVIEPIAEHEDGGMRHPLVWARELGHSRLVYDALGHDIRSYESAEHRELLERALQWLSRVPAPTFDAS
ncbi:ThuA domain-containing protein [Agromyces sp. Marseille-P2726]|uniref:ThuA domain-containing protein n=1 Tax=Agromyces sp. Marseille-P2726 TaxID=2709132 RepID=UPI00156F008C|nr:ThuA domain-containing protein [Agromyces sp. Marseille-P2726]